LNGQEESQGEENVFTTVVERVKEYEFQVIFDKPSYPGLIMDEPRPLGQEAGPNAGRLLSAAVGNCLAASLLFCLERSKVKVDRIRAEVTTQVARNEEGRWRIKGIQVKLQLAVEGEESHRIRRCIDIFENYCIVSSSVRQGIPSMSQSNMNER